MQHRILQEKKITTELLYVIKAMQKLYKLTYSSQGYLRRYSTVDSWNLEKLLAVMNCDVDKEFEELKKLLVETGCKPHE